MTLANGWTELLQDTEPENDFKGFETSNFHIIIRRARDDFSKSDVEQWLDNDNGDPGYQILSQVEIAESVLQGKEEHDNFDEEYFDVDEEDDDDVEEESTSSCPKLSVIRNHTEDVILYIGASSDMEVLAYYGHFRQLHSIISKEQHASGKQLKIDSFFQSTHSQ
jgi:hypothetical protein